MVAAGVPPLTPAGSGVASTSAGSVGAVVGAVAGASVRNTEHNRTTPKIAAHGNNQGRRRRKCVNRLVDSALIAFSFGGINFANCDGGMWITCHLIKPSTDHDDRLWPSNYEMSVRND